MSRAPRFYMVLVSGLAGLALTIAAIGAYGTLRHSVLQRTGEIGVRMAPGASRSQVRSMIMRDGIVAVLLGVAVGLAASWALSRLLESMLFGIRPNDPAAFGGASLLLLLVGLVGCYLAARRATEVDPIQALRSD